MKRVMNIKPSRALAWLLTLLPFLMVFLTYVIASDIRLAENAADKLLPSMSSIADALQRMAFEENKRSGDVLLWTDTWASLLRLSLGVGISALCGLVFGVLTGLIPLAKANLAPFIRALSMIPPMAVLPILFIIFGLGELSKVMLIIFGTAPFIMRDLQQRVEEIPAEQLIKAQTLGASTWQIIVRVVLPQIMPRLLESMRLSLGAAWLFLIAAEAIASTEGLGYRIFLVRRYLAMDVILPYVAWITILAFFMDVGIRRLSGFLFPWFYQPLEGAR